MYVKVKKNFFMMRSRPTTLHYFTTKGAYTIESSHLNKNFIMFHFTYKILDNNKTFSYFLFNKYIVWNLYYGYNFHFKRGCTWQTIIISVFHVKFIIYSGHKPRITVTFRAPSTDATCGISLTLITFCFLK